MPTRRPATVDDTQVPSTMKSSKFCCFDSKKQVKSCVLDMEHEGYWKTPVMIVLWSILRIIYYQIAHVSIRTVVVLAHRDIAAGISIAFSVAELIILATIIRTVHPKQDKALLEGIGIAYLSHMCATFLINFTLAGIDSHQMLIILVLEPVFTLLLSKVCVGERLQVMRMVAINIVTICAAGILYRTGHSSGLKRRSIVLVTSLVMLSACRNIAIKHIYSEAGHMRTRWRPKIMASIVTLLIVVGILESFYRPKWRHATSKGLVSGILHLSYTSIMWTTLLKQYSTTSVAVISMVAHLLTGMDLKIIVYFFSDLKLCALLLLFCGGLILYIISIYRDSQDKETTVTTNDMFTRLEFVLFLTITAALFFYILPPKWSSRDISNFRYLGFDMVVRKLWPVHAVST